MDQVTLGDQPVDAINLLATPGHGLFQCSRISFWLEFWTFYLKCYAVNLCWKTAWVSSFCKLHSFTIFHTVIYSQSRAARLDGLPGCSPPWKM